MAVVRSGRSLRLLTLHRILLELLQNADGPMTLAAIWKRVGESGCEMNSADPLAEINAVLNDLRNNGYPFKRVGKNGWKWGVGRSFE